LRGRRFHAVFVKMSEVTRKKPGARRAVLQCTAKLMRTQNGKKIV